jgi:hypothetical protein
MPEVHRTSRQIRPNCQHFGSPPQASTIWRAPESQTWYGSGGFKSKVGIGTSGTVSKAAALVAVDPVSIPQIRKRAKPLFVAVRLVGVWRAGGRGGVGGCSGRCCVRAATAARYFSVEGREEKPLAKGASVIAILS